MLPNPCLTDLKQQFSDLKKKIHKIQTYAYKILRNPSSTLFCITGKPEEQVLHVHRTAVGVGL